MTDGTHEIEATDAVAGRAEFALLCGEIQLGFLFDNYSTIKLKQGDGYRVDLICRFAELADSFYDKLSVKYWITDKPVSFVEAQEGFVKQVLGGITADCEANEYSYTE